MTLKLINMAISPAKANRLYWLGRYVERAASALHLLRRYNNDIIDNEDSSAHFEFCRLMGISCNYSSARDFVTSFLYDLTNPASISSILENAKNNAMLERGDIRTETLAYIEMAINFMNKCRAEGRGLYDMQYISDTLLAFWGALDEYVLSSEVRYIVYVGRYVEKIDLMIRFDYDVERIEDILVRLEGFNAGSKLAFCSESELDSIRTHLEARTYRTDDTLTRLNALFAA